MNPAAYYVGPEMQALQTASSAVSRMAKQEVNFCSVLLLGPVQTCMSRTVAQALCKVPWALLYSHLAAASNSNSWPMQPLYQPRSLLHILVETGLCHQSSRCVMHRDAGWCW